MIGSYLARLNPVPAFPEYTGPYKVGTVDIEIPVADLESPSPAPAHGAHIHTVQFRIFYPTSPDITSASPTGPAPKRINWLPAPQRSHVSAYTQFLGVGPMLAEVVSFLPRHLHYTTIPALKNAALLEPDTPSGRWPTMVFSHGLGGSRNAYSHIAGSVASHGVVVVCPEHRDGSSVVSFVRDPEQQDRFFKQSRRSEVPYNRVPHSETAEVWEIRDQQLRVRLWELGLVHDAVLKVDEDGFSSSSAKPMRNLNTSTPASALHQFADKLAVHNPGDIIWAGHSFGSASIVQLLKTTYYADVPAVANAAKPLFAPRRHSRLRAQITEKSPTILLDMWCFPLLSPTQTALHDLPLPVYADVPTAPGGTALLAVESDSFVKWKPHLHATAKILSPDPSADVVSAAAFERPASGVRLTEPNFFYVANSAHLNQSDFGLLFPWLTKKVFGAVEPERTIRLNLRAILQTLRVNGVPVARTWVGDLVDGSDADKLDVVKTAAQADESDTKSVDTDDTKVEPSPLSSAADGIDDDKAIFDRSGRGRVATWRWIDIVGMGGEAMSAAKALAAAADSTTDAVPSEPARIEDEMEPAVA